MYQILGFAPASYLYISSCIQVENNDFVISFFIWNTLDQEVGIIYINVLSTITGADNVGRNIGSRIRRSSNSSRRSTRDSPGFRPCFNTEYI